MKTKHHMIIAAGVCGLFLNVQSGFAQGSLTPPPGIITPTMKSLDQIEPRTPIATNTTPGDGTALFVISQPGSYYLTTNLTGVSGKSGIKITANNVTLDLNGFSVLGASNSENGILILSSSPNLTIRDGTISGWTNSSSYGVICQTTNVIFERLTISGNSSGLYCGGNTVVENCTVSGNNGTGITVFGSDSLVRDNRCLGNNAANVGGTTSLVVFGSNNRIEGNHVTSTGAGGYGIGIISSASYTNNIVTQNSVAGSGANNYSFNASQIVGPLITNTVSGIITNSNPWANFSF
jgi:parallel beta-helix repeat protein